MASNSTAWVLASRLSADEPKRQRFRRAISKFNASFLVRSNLISARRRSISCRDSSTESLAGEVSMVGVAEASSMGKVSASRVREARHSPMDNGDALPFDLPFDLPRDWPLRNPGRDGRLISS